MLGFQFHPESVLSSEGSLLLRQAMQYLVRHTDHQAIRQTSEQAINKEGK
jgi:hypothetical protein